ncbi:hypothetical protein GF324_01225 [bacterium]|nr:hypothetical protein [bacterium]
MAAERSLSLERRARRIAAVERLWFVPWLLLMLAVGLAVLEWVYHPMEQSLGQYMSWSRTIRERGGQGWELSREGEEAGRRLGQITDQIQQRRTASTSLDDWAEIPDMASTYTAFSLSPVRFLNLYDDLPEIMQRTLFNPIELFRMQMSGRWQRTYFLGEENRVIIYLVDPYNVVLSQATIRDEFFRWWDMIREPKAATLDDFPRFHGRSFSPDLFFQVVQPAGPVRLQGWDSRFTGNLQGELQRVGISDPSKGPFGVLGLEFVRNNESYVQFQLIPDSTARTLFEEVLPLALLMEEQERMSAPFNEDSNTRSPGSRRRGGRR